MPWKIKGDGRTPEAMVRDGRPYSLHCDQVGSLRVVADETGNVVKEVVYDAFGNILEDTNPAFRIPIGFAGGLFDPDTGFVRFGYRDYDPDTGRFTALDPIGLAGGDPDLYGYCLDDPVNLVDPEGLMGSIIRNLPKRIYKKINPMSPERIVKELADEEIDRIKTEYGDDNATIQKLEDLKNSMDNEGLPSPFEAFQMTLKKKHVWPYNDEDSNSTK